MFIFRSAIPLLFALFAGVSILISGCQAEPNQEVPELSWFVYNEPSGAFRQAAEYCSQQSSGRYRIDVKPLPTDADLQREQLVRRLAAKDRHIDIIGMDVIWTAEFAEAGWILPWPKTAAERISEGRLSATIESARYKNDLWASPFTANAQMLWYRNDRVKNLPGTWNELIAEAEILGNPGALQIQGQRYEGLTVFFISLLASAGGQVLEPDGQTVSLAKAPTLATLTLMKRIATSSAADPGLSSSREDQGRLAFETGKPTFMINYSFVWPSAQKNAPKIATNMAFSRWPSIDKTHPSRVAIGGLNLAIGAYTQQPDFAFEAAECLASAPNQIRAAELGGLPPTLAALYDADEVRRIFPFADVLRDTLRNGVVRPQTPVYNDISLAISRTLHPMDAIEPAADALKLRRAVQRALNSEGLM